MFAIFARRFSTLAVQTDGDRTIVLRIRGRIFGGPGVLQPFPRNLKKITIFIADNVTLARALSGQNLQGCYFIIIRHGQQL